MVKKKQNRKKSKTWVGDLLEGDWNKWDFAIIGILATTILYLVFIMDYGAKDFLDTIANGVLWALVVSLIISFVNSAKQKAKKS